MPQLSTKFMGRGRSAVLLIALLLLCPASAAAIPISQYQQNIKDAIASLDTLSEYDEQEESATDYENQLNHTVESVRTALPPKQTVEADGESYNVDNAWLHRALDELKQPAYRSERIEDLIESLNALESRVAERNNVGQRGESKEDAKNRLETILARPEYTSTAKGPNALTRLMRDFIEWLRKLFPQRKPAGPSSLPWINVVARILVLVAALAVVFFIAKLLLSRFRRTKKIKPRKKQEPRIVLGERLEPEQTATDLLSEAEALARRGELRAAIRKAYIALLVELGDRKIISLAQHKTNRDYLNALRDLPPLHTRMKGLTESFERHWYGFAEASQSDWQTFRDGYLAALHSKN